MASSPELIHATAIAVLGRAAILRGPSGAGKSDLALRCLAAAPSPFCTSPAQLVGDDQLLMTAEGGRLLVRAHENLAGKIEVRGIGILPVKAWTETAEVALLVDLVGAGDIARYPDPWPFENLLGVDLPVLRLWAFAASAPVKVLAALANPDFPRWT